SALSSKRRPRMLNKGIQAGHLEIVSSATRKNTRDVGVTFPTPSSRQPLQGGPAGPRPAGDTRPRRDRLQLLQGQHPQQGWGQQLCPCHSHFLLGFPCFNQSSRSRELILPWTLWLVPAEDLTCESRKENQCSASPGPGPAWFEPWSSRKPWREPLREKNGEEQPGLGQGGAAAP
ncbi:ALMS1 protein, partial [Nicator chloris]|nr:ALMS1 protein [Nicator chloris]